MDKIKEYFTKTINIFRDFRVVHLGLVDWIKRHGFKIILGVFVAIIAVTVIKDRTGVKIKTISVGDRKIEVEVVKSVEARALGLSGRDSLCDGCGMLFIFPQEGFHGIWMKAMKFDIDILWINAGKIIGITRSVPAPGPGGGLPSYQPPQVADVVLEVPSGWALKNGISTGDLVKY